MYPSNGGDLGIERRNRTPFCFLFGLNGSKCFSGWFVKGPKNQSIQQTSKALQVLLSMPAGIHGIVELS